MLVTLMPGENATAPKRNRAVENGSGATSWAKAGTAAQMVRARATTEVLIYKWWLMKDDAQLAVLKPRAK